MSKEATFTTQQNICIVSDVIAIDPVTAVTAVTPVTPVIPVAVLNRVNVELELEFDLDTLRNTLYEASNPPRKQRRLA